MHYLLKVSYDGSNYYGWAKQPNVPTISSTIEDATKKVFGKKYLALSSGRTDRYVHALEMPVLLKGEAVLPIEEAKERLNEELPKDIRVNEIELVDKEFQVRFHAKSKHYRYLTNIKGEGDANYYNNLLNPLNFDKLKEASKSFIGTKDFASFTGQTSYQSYVRTVDSIEVKLDGDILIIDIKGVGFMRYMVRNIVGALFAHNRGKVSDEEFNDYFTNPTRGKAHYKAVGAGLYLVKVYY